MKYIVFILILIHLFLKILALNRNPDNLGYDYPFSIKKGYNEVAIFLKNSIRIFDVSQTTTANLISNILPNSDPNYPLVGFTCDSGEEKGGIYFKSYYYTSCLTSSNSFKIINFKKGDSSVTTIPSSDFSFSTGSIRFFKISSTEELVGVAWLNGNIFNIFQLDQSGIKIEKKYTVSNIGRDIDCLYINKYQRIVCIFSYTDSTPSCKVNIFSGSEAYFTSNTKNLDGCVDHLSRKIRGNTDNNEDSDIFYYYFVGTNGIAYIMPVRLTSAISIDGYERM